MDDQDEAQRARAEARLGTTLKEKYRLDRVIGIGGMAAVFAATHRNQAELAVKLLHPELSSREDLKKRFLREGYVANSVKHPGAVLVVDDDVADDGSAFLVMELLRGSSVEDLWEKVGRQLSPRAVLSIAAQLLDVLAAAHEKAIVHRDLKPANLFLMNDGTLKVLDFGIARLKDAVGSEHATRTGTLMGTPAFMAPEQAQAVAQEIDAQTDLWAVGATMFTLLSGALVHEGDNSSQLLIRAGTTRARPLSAVAPDADARLCALVDRALAFEKKDRWSNAAEMQGAILAASRAMYGAEPGRDVLTQLFTESQRFVVDRATGGMDPTFQTPARLLPPSHAPPIPKSGLTTANPVSTEASTVRTGPAKRSRAPLFAGAAALVVIAAGASFAFLHGSSTNETATADTARAAVPSAAVPSSAPEPATAAPPPPPTATAPATAAAPLHEVASVAPPAPPPPATIHRSSAAPAHAAQPKPDCSTPYTLNPTTGEKKWKPECL